MEDGGSFQVVVAGLVGLDCRILTDEPLQYLAQRGKDRRKSRALRLWRTWRERV